MGTEVRLELGYDPVGHATRGDEAIRMVGELRPDLVLMDINSLVSWTALPPPRPFAPGSLRRWCFSPPSGRLIE